MTWQDRYLRRFYNRSRGFVDGTQEFHDLCRQNIPRGGRILEIGAGPSNQTSRFLATLGQLHGLDPDNEITGNDALKTAAVLTGTRFPFADGSFDACVSNYVLEHIAEPGDHLNEVARVLRPGGCYIFRTPNRFHYTSLAASLTPHWVHVAVANRLRKLPNNAHDPYPTAFALNSRRAIRHEAKHAGLTVQALRMIEKEPSYGMASRALFLAFTAYERLVNKSELVADLRANIFGVLRKAK